MSAISMEAANGSKSTVFTFSLFTQIYKRTLLNSHHYCNSYAQSDYATREETQEQKKFIVTKVDDYGKETKEEVYGNTNKGSSYWVSPEGEKFTLTWAADDAGFQPAGAHLPVAPVHEYELPVAPVHEYELPVAPVHEYELPVAPALPYKRTGAGY